MIRQLDEWIRLVVLESDIIAWLVPFDEIRLEEQGLGLCIGDRNVDVICSRDHLLDPFGPGIDVRANPITQVQGLPDVEYSPIFEELIDTRIRRDVGRRIPDGGRFHKRNQGRESFEPVGIPPAPISMMEAIQSQV